MLGSAITPCLPMRATCQPAGSRRLALTQSVVTFAPRRDGSPSATPRPGVAGPADITVPTSAADRELLLWQGAVGGAQNGSVRSPGRLGARAQCRCVSAEPGVRACVCRFRHAGRGNRSRRGGIAHAAPAILAKGMYVDGRRFDSVVSKETAALVATRLKEAGLPLEMFQVDEAVDGDADGRRPGSAKGRPRSQPRSRQALLRSGKGGRQDDRRAGNHRVADRPPRHDVRGAAGAVAAKLARRGRHDPQQPEGDRVGVADAATVPRSRRLCSAISPSTPPHIDRSSSNATRTGSRRSMPVSHAARPCLVVVGAAHLVGPDGLLTLLQRKGYRTEQQ